MKAQFSDSLLQYAGPLREARGATSNSVHVMGAREGGWGKDRQRVRD